VRPINTPKPVAWSFSRLDTFEQCPNKVNEISLKKTTPFGEQTVQQRQGDLVHEMLADRLAPEPKPFPFGYEYLEAVVAPILAVRHEGQIFNKLKLAWDKDFKPCGYKDWDRAWLRVDYDFAFIRGKTMFIFDWKTGNPDFKDLQLKLYAATAFLSFPDVMEIHTAFVWLKTKFLDSKTYRRDELTKLWDEILPRVQKLQDANALDIWPAIKNKYCNWCQVKKVGRCPEFQ
jgi:hypothetical protein